ncbi:unnamed protein product, partial [marine sediment metagenome]
PENNFLTAINQANKEYQTRNLIKQGIIRLLDIIIASVCLVLLLPLLLFISFWIKTDSKGLAMFAQ